MKSATGANARDNQQGEAGTSRRRRCCKNLSREFAIRQTAE